MELQVLAGSFPARALTTTSEEKLAIWAIMAKIRPAYQEWQTRATREIPGVMLELGAKKRGTRS